MLVKRSRVASIGCLLLASVLPGADLAQALDLSSLTLVYQEDFEGEVGFPTTPEVNTLSIGANSSVGVDGLSNPFAAPFISSGAVIGSIHSEVPTATQNVHVPATFSESFGMRASFDSLSLGTPAADGSGSAGVVAAFGIAPFTTSVVEASLGVSRSSGSESGFVVLRYTEPPAAPVTSFLALSTNAVTAVLSGAAFTVDLAFDKAIMIGVASVDVAGVGDFSTPLLDVSGVTGITSSTPLVASNLFLSENFGLDVDVRMEELSVFVLPASAPDFSDLDLAYEENYVGETASPLTPEVDPLGLGSLDRQSVPGFGAGPALSGSAAHVSVISGAAQDSLQLMGLATGGLSAGTTGLRADFANALNSGAVMRGGISATTVNGAQVALDVSGAGASYALEVQEFDSMGSPLTSSLVNLGAPTAAMIESGAAFTLDLRIHRSAGAGTAVGSIDFSGSGTVATSPISLSPDAVQDIAFLLHFGGMLPDPLPGSSVDLDLTGTSLYVETSLLGDTISIEEYTTSGGTLHVDSITVAAAVVELLCPVVGPGAFDLCNADIPGASEGSFDIESDTLTLQVGTGGGSQLFDDEPFHGYIFSDLDFGLPIRGFALTTDIAGLDDARVSFTATSVSVNLSGLTVDPGEFFTITLSSTRTPRLPSLSPSALLALLAAIGCVGFQVAAARSRELNQGR